MARVAPLPHQANVDMVQSGEDMAWMTWSMLQRLHHLKNLFSTLSMADPAFKYCLGLFLGAEHSTYVQGPRGALTTCFEKRILSDRRGIVELTAFRSLHCQLENEPFAKKIDQKLPLSP